MIQENIPVLGEAVDQVGGPQIRNIGTIGGNICNGAVSADSAPTVFSLNALLRIEDGNNGRTVPVRDFYLGPGRVDSEKRRDSYPCDHSCKGIPGLSWETILSIP